MNEQFSTILSICIIPQVVKLINDNEINNEIESINKFYGSNTYKLLEQEETKLWHYSPLTIYNMWKSEIETGSIIFPED